MKYSLLGSHWGQGLASEFVTALLAYGVREFELTRVIATLSPDNLASKRVLEKSGLTYREKQEDELGLPMLVLEWQPG